MIVKPAKPFSVTSAKTVKRLEKQRDSMLKAVYAFEEGESPKQKADIAQMDKQTLAAFMALKGL